MNSSIHFVNTCSEHICQILVIKVDLLLEQHILQLIPLFDCPRNAFMCLSISLDSALGAQPSFRSLFPAFAAVMCASVCLWDVRGELQLIRTPLLSRRPARRSHLQAWRKSCVTDSSQRRRCTLFPLFHCALKPGDFTPFQDNFSYVGGLVWSSSLSLAEVEKATNDVLRCAVWHIFLACFFVRRFCSFWVLLDTHPPSAIWRLVISPLWWNADHLHGRSLFRVQHHPVLMFMSQSFCTIFFVFSSVCSQSTLLNHKGPQFWSQHSFWVEWWNRFLRRLFFIFNGSPICLESVRQNINLCKTE